MTRIEPQEVEEIAEEAYIFAYPMIDSYKMIFSMVIHTKSPFYEAPFNQFSHKSLLLGPEHTAIVRPNNDTFYSAIWMDLRAEPMILQVPAINDKRYYSFQLLDLYTHIFGYIGTRTTGFDAGTFMIAGPNWTGEKLEGVEQVMSTECDFALALVRTQVNGADDVDAAMAVQQGFNAMPLSQFIHAENPPSVPLPNFPVYDPQQANSAGFIGYLNFLLGHVKPHPSESELLERFAKIGIAPNKAFDLQGIEPELLRAIEAGVANAQEKIQKKVGTLGVLKYGWMQIAGVFGSRSDMQGRYLARAAAAAFGLWGNSIEEAFYPECSTDADGETLDASKHNYVLHFGADELPPVNAFWSLSMYKLPEQLFIENPINRYRISSTTEDLVYGSDGSLTVYLQSESPGVGRESNWLPTPNGPFSLQARLYWPKPEALAPLYTLPPVQKA